MNELYEALKGFTDVPLAILSLIFGFLCHSKMKSKDWSTLFFCISITAFLGAFVHGVALPTIVAHFIWLFLYPFLFESVRRFGVLFPSLADKQKIPSSHIVLLLEMICYVVALVFLFSIGDYDIYIFAVFAVIVLLLAIVRIIKVPKIPKMVTVFLILVSIPLLLQICESFIPYAVVIEHSFLAVELYLAYRMAIFSERDQIETK